MLGRLGVAAAVEGHCGQGPDGFSLRQLQATELVSRQLSLGIHSQPTVQDAAGGATAAGAAATGAAAGACGTGEDGARTGATAGVAAAEEGCGMGAGPYGVASGSAVPSIPAGAGATFGCLGMLLGFDVTDPADGAAAAAADAAAGAWPEAAVGAVAFAPSTELGTAGLEAADGGGFGTLFNTDVEPNAPCLILENVTEIGDCFAFA
mmetsp:Transcript_58460/g.115917  ORF Transcript_58460/g.115917 Transcript_58460/m.115917 type:complete len:207 (-) Transcript_58460:1440-2060(-)